jgi:tetratricopeptide (TPR) repeat protein
VPPALPHDLFAAAKPARGLRLFVLGGSSAAGFPFPHNGTFSRVLGEALRDVLPNDSIEVVNVAIAGANSSSAMRDFAGEVIAERPDAVLIYGGRDERTEPESAPLSAGEEKELDHNLRSLLRRLRDSRIPAFVGSLAPRAPSPLNAGIRAAATGEGAIYVPVAEAFDSAAAAAPVPGHELFIDGTHAARDGMVLIAGTFFQALRAAHFLGREAQENRLAPWPDYEARMVLSPFDNRVASLLLEPPDSLGSYTPAGPADGYALLVARGEMSWERAKIALAEQFITAAQPDSAVLECRGLIRDAPVEPLPREMAARALLLAGREAEAEPYLRSAYALQPTPMSTLALATLSAQRHEYPAAIKFYLENLQFQPGSANTMYQLSLAYALTGDPVRAQQYSAQASAIQPGLPGLQEWMAKLRTAIGH